MTKKFLAIDTSCDETSAAVTEGTNVYSNVLWSQASLHAKFGGVYPSLAKRAHKERIDWVIQKAIKNSGFKVNNLDAIAVTVGPGLAIALEVGIEKSKELAQKYQLPLIPVNHVEGHVLSVLARSKNSKAQIQNFESLFPALSLIASGKHTDLIYVKKIGSYKILASTVDDALGEALDKAARMLGLGYPGGAILEKFAKEGNLSQFNLPVPMIGKENQMKFSYSGIKTAMWKLVEDEKPLTKRKIQNLAAVFQDKAFLHVERLTTLVLSQLQVKSLFFGGGVSANIELRRRLRKISKQKGVRFLIPYTKKLCTDNAAMIGVASYFKFGRKEYLKPNKLINVDRIPRAKVSDNLYFESFKKLTH
jgi:N6-L-threonylcarbamoyladenine synthase